MAALRRGLGSLSFSIAVPLSLTLAIILLFGSASRNLPLIKVINWFPPLWLMYVGSLGSAMLMGLSAWLVWVEAGFRCQPDLLPLYIAEVCLSLIWYPLVLEIGAAYLGLFFCLVHFGTLMTCYHKFRHVNLVAGEFVKPCLAWLDIGSLPLRCCRQGSSLLRLSVLTVIPNYFLLRQRDSVAARVILFLATTIFLPLKTGKVDNVKKYHTDLCPQVLTYCRRCVEKCTYF